MRLLRFTAPGKPVPKHYGRAGSMQFKDRGCKAYQERVAIAAKQAGARPLDGLVKLVVTFGFEWPRSKWRKRKPRGWSKKTTAPDGKNLYAAVEDALKGICYADDRIVAEGSWVKWYVRQGDPPQTRVSVMWFDAEDDDESV